MSTFTDKEYDAFYDNLLARTRMFRTCLVTQELAMGAFKKKPDVTLGILKELVKKNKLKSPPGVNLDDHAKALALWLTPGMVIQDKAEYYYSEEIVQARVTEILMGNLEEIRLVADVRRYVALTREIVVRLSERWQNGVAFIYAVNHVLTHGVLHALNRVKEDKADPELKLFIISKKPGLVGDMRPNERAHLIKQTKEYSAELRVNRLVSVQMSEDSDPASKNKGKAATEVKKARDDFSKLLP